MEKLTEEEEKAIVDFLKAVEGVKRMFLKILKKQ